MGRENSQKTLRSDKRIGETSGEQCDMSQGKGKVSSVGTRPYMSDAAKNPNEIGIEKCPLASAIWRLYNDNSIKQDKLLLMSKSLCHLEIIVLFFFSFFFNHLNFVFPSYL